MREATLHGGILCEVLFNSSKFCLPGLLNICECVLKEMVSTSNVEQVYVAARDSSAAQLVQYCLHFGKKNRAVVQKRIQKSGADPRRAEAFNEMGRTW